MSRSRRSGTGRERGPAAAELVSGVAAICAPLDLAACGHHLAHGFNRVYTQHFLKTLKAVSAARLRQLMASVVRRGTASGALGPLLQGQVTAGGKTGTAQRLVTVFDPRTGRRWGSGSRAPA